MVDSKLLLGGAALGVAWLLRGELTGDVGDVIGSDGSSESSSGSESSTSSSRGLTQDAAELFPSVGGGGDASVDVERIGDTQLTTTTEGFDVDPETVDEALDFRREHISAEQDRDAIESRYGGLDELI